jgi:hypothetical protein
VKTHFQKSEYRFSELSEAAKQKAREAFIGDFYLGNDWWESTFEDANRVAKILGLDLETTRRHKSGAEIVGIGIFFSGFWSQGDGASFAGYYNFNPQAVDQIKAYCAVPRLDRIASELLAMQVSQRLCGCTPFSAKITRSGGYCHAYSMDFEILDFDSEEIGIPDEERFAKIMRDFAGWIYESLEETHDYLVSDECVDEQLVDEIFDEDGHAV